MPLDLKGLKKKAKAATPGPWSTYKDGPAVFIKLETEPTVVAWAQIAEAGNKAEKTDCRADAAFIAAANPSVVLELIQMAEDAIDILRFYAKQDNMYKDHGMGPESELLSDAGDKARAFFEKYGEGK